MRLLNNYFHHIKRLTHLHNIYINLNLYIISHYKQRDKKYTIMVRDDPKNYSADSGGFGQHTSRVWPRPGPFKGPDLKGLRRRKEIKGFTCLRG